MDNLVELIGHASLRVSSGGKTILTDPWYVDPINCNTHSHWPPLAKSIEEIAEQTDVIYISHIHPDHFDPNTLKYFSKSIPVYIGNYKAKAFKDEISSLGFNVFECDFQKFVPVDGTDFEVCIIESDYGESAAFDSSIIIKTPTATVFNNNDCFLKDEKYQWVKENCQVDYAFLGYSPASYFPICFEFPKDEKDRHIIEASERRYSDFTKVAEILRPQLAVPFAMGIRFLHPDMVWQNISFNSAYEAVKRLEPLSIRGEVMCPGDILKTSGEVVKLSPTNEESDLKNLEKLIEEKSEYHRKIWQEEVPARADLLKQFETYISSAWQKLKANYKKLDGTVISYKIEGEISGEFCFAFEGGDLVVEESVRENSDMRYTYPDKLLQLCLDGKIDWDELHFSNRISVLQNKYSPGFYEMLRSFNGVLS